VVGERAHVFEPGHDAAEAGQRDSQISLGHIRQKQVHFVFRHIYRYTINENDHARRHNLEGSSTLLDGRTALGQRQLGGKIPVVLGE
jgi:hypothetical protein